MNFSRENHADQLGYKEIEECCLMFSIELNLADLLALLYLFDF